MESIISTFHIDWKIVIAQMINFGVVFAVLYVFALKPLNKLMNERKEKILRGVEDSKSNAEILEKTRLEYEKILSKARSEANSIFQDGKKEAEAKKIKMIDAAKIEVSGIIEQGKKMLEVQKEKMMLEAKKEIVSLAIMAAEKLIGVKSNGSLNEKAIKELDNL